MGSCLISRSVCFMFPLNGVMSPCLMLDTPQRVRTCHVDERRFSFAKPPTFRQGSALGLLPFIDFFNHHRDDASTATAVSTRVPCTFQERRGEWFWRQEPPQAWIVRPLAFPSANESPCGMGKTSSLSDPLSSRMVWVTSVTCSPLVRVRTFNHVRWVEASLSWDPLGWIGRGLAWGGLAWWPWWRSAPFTKAKSWPFGTSRPFGQVRQTCGCGGLRELAWRYEDGLQFVSSP